MKDNFKKLNTITDGIKRKIYRKKDIRFILIIEKWKDIVGIEYYHKSSPIKITRDQNLKVEVNSDILLDFKFSSDKFLNNINNILGYNKNIVKILIMQKFT